MHPSANNQGRRWDEISCCLESYPLVSDMNLPESQRNKISVVSSHKKKKPMGLKGRAEKQLTKGESERRFP